MNTAPKLSTRDKLKELLSSAYHHGRNSFHFNTGDQADKFLAAIAPPSGEGVEQALMGALDRLEAYIPNGHARKYDVREIRRLLAVRATPQAAPVDGGVSANSGKLISDVMSHHAPKIVHKRVDSFPEYTYTREQVLSMLWDLQGNLTAPPPASQERDVAPWLDFAGRPIHAGDRIKHPDGVSGTVVYLPMWGAAGDAWRVVYDGEVTLSRLNLQIGDKGQAIVLSPNCGACGGTIKSDPLTGTICACVASPPSSAAEGPKCLHCGLVGGGPCMFDGCPNRPDAAEQAKPDIVDAVDDPNGECPTCHQALHVEQAQAGELRQFEADNSRFVESLSRKLDKQVQSVSERPWFVSQNGTETRGFAYDFPGDTHVVPVAVAQAEIDRLSALLMRRLAGGVTDAMIEAAWMAYTGRAGLGEAFAKDASCMMPCERQAIRAALVAAWGAK